MTDIVERLRDPKCLVFASMAQPDCVLDAADEIERLRAQVATLTEAIDAARTAMSAAPAWHEMHRAAIEQLKMAKYVTETDYMEEPT